MSGAVNQREALLRLGASTAEAIAQVLEMFAPGEVERGEVSVLEGEGSPFASLEPGTVAAGVAYVDGVTGANVFLAPSGTARLLATKMGAGADVEDEAPLTELELSAVSEASNQMMAAAAGAVGVVLGQEIEISPPQTRVLQTAGEADELFGAAPYATATTFLVGGAPCRLVQLVPSAFVIRVGQAMNEFAGEEGAGAASGPGAPDGSGPRDVEETLRGITMRVWAELGRTRLPLSDTLTLPLGSVVELDRHADAPVDLYVNGLRFAEGILLVDDNGNWTIRLTGMESREPAALTT
ncbi:MAG TPA: FliM/FliN family flagellar motor switch protein [Solirubrobacteraceae bacterium]|nr:FliM/FliN family flagellar motor switch protein [Solirubrobacteraceae bacterium]